IRFPCELTSTKPKHTVQTLPPRFLAHRALTRPLHSPSETEERVHITRVNGVLANSAFWGGSTFLGHVLLGCGINHPPQFVHAASRQQSVVAHYKNHVNPPGPPIHAALRQLTIP
ncbi:unnamed protein product, partial [Ixodes pacificus]